MDIKFFAPIVFLLTFIACGLLLVTKKWHGGLSMDQTDGIQKFHTAPTPRVGGLPIAMGLVASLCFLSDLAVGLMTSTLLASLPAFLFGLAEDLTKRVGVLLRLLATMASGVLAWWLTDYSLSRLDIAWFDVALQHTMVSVLFTAFAVGGVANALNIIDGFNGLASASAIIIFLGFAYIASQVGDLALAQVAVIFACVVLGFFCMNWPFGNIFLGDGGAYLLGFSMAWVAICLVQRHGNVSAFAALVLCAHPINEVLFSVYRRKVKRAHPGMPDRLHFHSLFHRRYVSRWLKNKPDWMQNSATGLLVSMPTLAALLLACLTYKSTRLSIISYILLTIIYLVLYLKMTKHTWCFKYGDHG